MPSVLWFHLSLSPSVSLSLYLSVCLSVCLSLYLSRVLSAMAHWAAIFAETEYLPLVAFPFVKLFQNNPLLCFEVVATVIGRTGVTSFFLERTPGSCC